MARRTPLVCEVNTAWLAVERLAPTPEAAANIQKIRTDLVGIACGYHADTAISEGLALAAEGWMMGFAGICGLIGGPQETYEKAAVAARKVRETKGNQPAPAAPGGSGEEDGDEQE
jgi:hypothetical protein